MLLLWVFPMSTLILIFLPKFIAYRNAERGVDTTSQPVRGERTGTKVSGLTPTTDCINAREGTVVLNSTSEAVSNRESSTSNAQELSSHHKAPVVAENTGAGETPGLVDTIKSP
jgi:hypothetical protein